MNRITYPLLTVITGILLLTFSVYHLIPLLSAPIDIATSDRDELKNNAHVNVDVSIAFDYLISVRKDSSKDDSYRYYALPFIQNDANGYRIDRFLLVKVPAKEFDTFDKAMERFHAWWADSNRDDNDYPDEILSSVDGELESITEEDRSIIRDYFDDPDFERYVIPYVLCPKSKTDHIIFIVISIIVIITGILFLLKALSEAGHEKRFRERTKESGYYNVPSDINFDNKPKE